MTSKYKGQKADKYSIKPTRVHYDPLINKIVDKGGKGIYSFDSNLEFRVYKHLLFLSTLGVMVEPKPKTLDDWDIDFSLYATNNQGSNLLRWVVNHINSNDIENINHIYIEVKGVLNQGVIDHISKIYNSKPLYLDRIVLIGDVAGAIVLENKTTLDIYVKRMISLSMFNAIISEYARNGA